MVSARTHGTARSLVVQGETQLDNPRPTHLRTSWFIHRSQVPAKAHFMVTKSRERFGRARARPSIEAAGLAAVLSVIN